MVGIPLRGLESFSALSADAANFRPGAHDSQIGIFMDQMTFPSALAGGNKTEFVTRDMYNQLLFHYNAEVSYLRQQIMELTSKFAEFDSWKQQTNCTIRSLRDHHRAIQRKIGDEIITPKLASTSEPKMFETESATNKTCIVPISVPIADAGVPQISQGFDAEGLKVSKSSMSIATFQGSWEAAETTKVEWNIRNFSTKLKAAMGRPLVSSPFNLWGLEEVRLMVTPLMQESNVGPRSRREKEQFSKMISEGPLDASLVLKIPNARSCMLRYCLRVGKEKTGPHECDFSNTAIDNRGSFGINWLLELDKDLSITVSVEMLPPPEIHQRLAAMRDDDEVTPLPGNTPSVPPGLPSPLSSQRIPPGLPPPMEATDVRSGMDLDETRAPSKMPQMAPQIQQGSINHRAHLGVGADASVEESKAVSASAAPAEIHQRFAAMHVEGMTSLPCRNLGIPPGFLPATEAIDVRRGVIICKVNGCNSS